MDSGEVLDRRIATTRERLTAMFWGPPPMRVLLEAATESEWVAQHLETLGHEVIVADPNFIPMYGHRSRRVKTDRRDVAALAEACRQGCYRAAHRRSATQRTDAARFRRAGQVASDLGLVPSEYSSGEQHRRGRVLRSAHPHVQSLLVQAAWRLSVANPNSCGSRRRKIARVSGFHRIHAAARASFTHRAHPEAARR
jgi:transposase